MINLIKRKIGESTTSEQRTFFRNIIDSIFTDQTCVLHTTEIGNMVRDSRKIFLHKGSWHKFKGYSFAQMHKMNLKDATGKRKEIRDKYGFDCYLESETEFLTDLGWKKFDEIDYKDKLATVIPKTGDLQFQKPIGRIDKISSEKCYIIDNYLTRCVVTPNHKMLVSPCRRSLKNNFSTEYVEDISNWGLKSCKDLLEERKSSYHIRKCLNKKTEEYNIDDSYLKLAGMFLSEGTINFRDGKVKTARLSQTKNGKEDFYTAADELQQYYKIKKYSYVRKNSGKKEDIWVIDRLTAEKLYNDFGHGSLKKKMPNWAYKLSYRQAKILWHHYWLGDGTFTENGDVIYTSNKNLADGLQAMMTISGYSCSIRGPYTSFSSFTNSLSTSYQIYLPNLQNKFSFVVFNKNIKTKQLNKERVVCFDVPNGTLVTRSNGKIAIQGNCKYAMHLVRLLNEAEQILTKGDLNLQENNEQLKAIRRGEVKQEEILKWASDKEAQLEKVYLESKLPWGPDEDKIKDLLLKCLEHHYGSLDKAVERPDKYKIALMNVKEILDSVKI